MKFSKSLIASATLLAMASAAQAQFKTDGLLEVYGRASFSVDRLDDGYKYNSMNLSSNASRLGFKGSKTIGELTGIWQIEQQIEFNMSNSKDDTYNRLASRDTFAGLQGAFGTVRIGKFDTPMKVAREPFNLFGDQLGDMRNLTRVSGAKFDERLNNMLEYQTPVMNGFQAKIARSFHSGTSVENTTAGVEKKQDATSLSLGYKADKIDASLAYETYGEDNALSSSVNGKRNATRAAISYKITPDLRAVGFYQTADSVSGTAVNDSATVTGVGLEYMVTPKIALKGHYMDRNADKVNRDSKMSTVGAEYRYSKELRFYANYASVSNGSDIKLNPWAEGRTAAPGSTQNAGLNGKTANGLSIGMRYDF
jgi:predicted porin